ncbi:MAG: alpha-D-ribose 1-methylphosphonate 5-triphosphate diphosphatase, partial [Rhodospirillaceae bacterium]|nr:alpha-D-ribose 1-methylphosphonate 5-triphosphate diphosphatase [Rhodospirillaceae bacterium]
FDAVCIGEVAGRPVHEVALDTMLAGLEQARDGDALRADHHLHLRCEITDPKVMRYLDPRIEHDMVQLVSVMDHAPGHRQMKDVEHLRNTWMIGARGLSPEQADRHIEELMRRSREVAPDMRKQVTEVAHSRGLAVASHDDETIEHITMAADLDIDIAEFPTTAEAAHEAHRRGIAVLMGGPNLVRGGSHGGNVAAGDLANAGVLDALMSDYIMSSMLMGALTLTNDTFGFALPEAIAMVSSSPARIAGLDDRGRIEVGLRADLVHIRIDGGRPSVRRVWREGRQVY